MHSIPAPLTMRSGPHLPANGKAFGQMVELVEAAMQIIFSLVAQNSIRFFWGATAVAAPLALAVTATVYADSKFEFDVLRLFVFVRFCKW